MRHHWLSILSILSAVLLADLATPPATPWGDIRVMHTWNTIPANWESLGPPPTATTIDLYIALQPHRENALIDALHEVSDPRNQRHVVLITPRSCLYLPAPLLRFRYGAHLSKEQVTELVTPSQDTLELVHSWLEHYGVPSSSISTSHGGGWLTITGVPVSQADKLLCASYRVYGHTGTNQTETILRTTSRNRSSEEEVVVNATSRESVRVLSRRDDMPVTPAFLRWLYKTRTYVPAAIDRNALGVLGLQNEYPSQVDLTQFMETHRADAVAAGFLVLPVNGARGALLNGRPVSALPDRGDAYLEWFRFLLNQPYLPPTITISYANPEPSLPPAYATAVCLLFAQLGLRGVSVLISSGDNGVGTGDCKDSSGNVQFIPMFPASCPWVTSVGGTRDYGPEVAMYLSGGGFSRYFPRPNYQNGAVFTYLQYLGNQYAGFYNPWGRSIPDISAQSHRFNFVMGTEWRPLGFLNLWLYDRGRAGLNDIVSGTNPGCNTDGFTAIAGWDPVTGLGTPDFVRLQLVLDYLV
ncbi:subtilisin-like protein [Lactarius psammicola]|nr:subtilisin-like protein [Lactarius psammicola]